MEIIKLVNINKIYKSGKIKIHVLKNINLKIFKGEFLGIIGPSGSGKTTLMNIIGCLDNDISGDYFFEGKNIAKLKDKELSKIRNRKIGFIFQSFNLISYFNVLENVLLPTFYNKEISKKEALERAKNLINFVGLSDRIHHKPNELSGGQQQRVAIARALINNPDIILADEPTGNLDSKATEEIISLFFSLNENGHTIVLVTHELTIAQKLKRIVKIKDGIIEADYKNNI